VLHKGYLLTYLPIYPLTLLTPCSTVLLKKLTGFQPVNKFPTFYGARRFITAFTSARHLSLSWASSIQSIPPQPTSWRSILILSSYPRLGLPSGLFPSGFPTKTLYMPLLSPYALHVPPISFFSILSPEQYGVICTENKALRYVVFSTPLSPCPSYDQIFHATPYSKIPSLQSSFNVSDQVSHLFKTGKIIFLYIAFFKILDRKMENKIFCTEW